MQFDIRKEVREMSVCNTERLTTPENMTILRESSSYWKVPGHSACQLIPEENSRTRFIGIMHSGIQYYNIPSNLRCSALNKKECIFNNGLLHSDFFALHKPSSLPQGGRQG